MGLGWKLPPESDHSSRRTLWAGTCAHCEAQLLFTGLRQASGHTQASVLLLLPSELPSCWASPAQSWSPGPSHPFPCLEGSGRFRPLPLHTFLRVEVADISTLLFSASSSTSNTIGAGEGEQLASFQVELAVWRGRGSRCCQRMDLVGSAPLPGSSSSSTQNYCTTEGRGVEGRGAG